MSCASILAWVEDAAPHPQESSSSLSGSLGACKGGPGRGAGIQGPWVPFHSLQLTHREQVMSCCILPCFAKRKLIATLAPLQNILRSLG